MDEGQGVVGPSLGVRVSRPTSARRKLDNDDDDDDDNDVIGGISDDDDDDDGGLQSALLASTQKERFNDAPLEASGEVAGLAAGDDDVAVQEALLASFSQGSRDTQSATHRVGSPLAAASGAWAAVAAPMGDAVVIGGGVSGGNVRHERDGDGDGGGRATSASAASVSSGAQGPSATTHPSSPSPPPSSDDDDDDDDDMLVEVPPLQATTDYADNEVAHSSRVETVHVPRTEDGEGLRNGPLITSPRSPSSPSSSLSARSQSQSPSLSSLSGVSQSAVDVIDLTEEHEEHKGEGEELDDAAASAEFDNKFASSAAANATSPAASASASVGSRGLVQEEEEFARAIAASLDDQQSLQDPGDDVLATGITVRDVVSGATGAAAAAAAVAREQYGIELEAKRAAAAAAG
jgi:hypothetical protein